MKFKACGLPDFNTLTLGVFASFAQYETENIKQRTSDALQAKLKRDGKRWGIPNLTSKARKKGAEATRELARRNPNNQKAMAFIAMMDTKHFTLQEDSRQSMKYSSSVLLSSCYFMG